MKEWQRTVILILLLALGIGFLVWNTHATDVNFLQSL